MKRRIIDFLRKNGRIIKIFIAIVLLYILFSKVDILESIKVFSKINYLIIVPIILYIPGLILNSTRLYQIIDKKISTKELFKINWISAFFSNFLPSSVGGDSYKVISLRKRIGTQFVIESVFIDRVLGVFGIIILSCLSSFFVFRSTSNQLLFYIPWVLLGSFIIFFLFFGKKNINLFKKYNFNISEYKKKIFNYKIIFNSILYTVLGAISLSVYYFMFGYNINFFVVIGFYCITQLLNMVPISINAIGIQEASYVYFFSLVGVPITISLSLSILSRFLSISMTSIGGIIYLFNKN